MSNSLVTAFLALNDYFNRSDIGGVSVTIRFPTKDAQWRFERQTRQDGLGYLHCGPSPDDGSVHAVTPREALPGGVNLQIAGIDIKYEYPPTYRGPRY